MGDGTVDFNLTKTHFIGSGSNVSGSSNEILEVVDKIKRESSAESLEPDDFNLTKTAGANLQEKL